jgi:hypothetical protein
VVAGELLNLCHIIWRGAMALSILFSRETTALAHYLAQIAGSGRSQVDTHFNMFIRIYLTNWAGVSERLPFATSNCLISVRW